MAHRIPADRVFIFQRPEQEIYFNDGHICVTSGAITVGNPPTNTISIQNLFGVSLSKAGTDWFWLIVFFIGALFFTGLTLFSAISDYEGRWYFAFAFGIFALWFWIRLYLDHLRESPWEVKLKIGGMTADEVFLNPNQEWAEKFSQAVSYALTVEQHRRSGGTQPLPPPPIFPNPTFSRN